MLERLASSRAVVGEYGTAGVAIRCPPAAAARPPRTRRPGRFERDEQGALGPLAGRPYRRLGMSQPPTPTPRSRPAVQVEKRSLRDYAAVAR